MNSVCVCVCGSCSALIIAPEFSYLSDIFQYIIFVRNWLECHPIIWVIPAQIAMWCDISSCVITIHKVFMIFERLTVATA